MKTVESRIDDFLSDTEGQPLRVAVGYTSVWGIAWLARRTQGRRVDLLIGNCSPLYFKNATAEDRQMASKFLDRSDVEVKNWYKRRGGAKDMNAKVWISRDSHDRRRLLSGSANLTRRGLRENIEAIGEYRGEDLQRTRQNINEICDDKAWDAKDRLREYINR